MVKLEEYADEFEDIEDAIIPTLFPVPGPRYGSLPLWPAPLLIGTLLLLLCMWLLSVLVLFG